MKILSGIQPSGKLHIGNYFGMMKTMISHMENSELYVFIVDLHALTSVHDRDRLARRERLRLPPIFSPLALILTTALSGYSQTCPRCAN